jgi:hypothetical protein
MEVASEWKVVRQCLRREAADESGEAELSRPACPVCGGSLMDIRRKLCCVQCHSIIETCCD